MNKLHRALGEWLLLAAVQTMMLPAIHAQALPGSVVLSESLHTGFGGRHEFGGYVGHSWVAGPTFGYDRNTTYTSIVLRYSYLVRSGAVWNLRWAPELTALADLYERAPSTTNPAAPIRHLGAGFSLANFQAVFLPVHRIQPFVDEAGGLLVYTDHVLSPGGTQFMFQIDYGAGMNVFLNPRDAATIGFRYQHQSNADIGLHNPGTDAELFYVGFSRFFTKAAR